MYYINETIRVYYVGLETGLTVKFNFWDPDKIQVVVNATATELGSELYYYDLTPNKLGDYGGYANCSSRPRRMNYAYHISNPIKTSVGGLMYPTPEKEIDITEILNLISKKSLSLEKILINTSDNLTQVKRKTESLEQQLTELKKELQKRDNLLLSAMKTDSLIDAIEDEDLPDPI